MGATLTFIDLAGSIALLLWGVHMVQSGITRALGANLRRALTAALGNRFKAFFAGIGVTALLQSSTATGLMAASFAAGGAIDLVPALAVMLGANVGTTLIVQVLSFDVARVAPLFILIGVMMFRRGGAARNRDLGRVGIGLGLMLLALSDLLSLVTPYEDVPSLRLLMGTIATDPIVAVIIAAALTWAAHSSVAIVILIVSLASRGVVPPDAAFALVLGANLGTAINPVLESGTGSDPAARRLPIGNLLNRVLGCAVALALIGPIGRLLVTLEPHKAGRAVADFHTAFNLILAFLFLPALSPYARLLQRLLPAKTEASDPGQPQYLDRNALEAPSVALANTAREALRMVDLLEAMLGSALDDLESKDRGRVAGTRRMDDAIDHLNRAIRDYLASIDVDLLDDHGHKRLTEILVFTTNLEHAGDVIERSLSNLAAKRIKLGVPLGQDSLGIVHEMAERLQANLRLAAAVFMTDDVTTARRLAEDKSIFRDIESRATSLYFQHLRGGRAGGAESLQLDVLRDLRRINSHLVAAVRPILDGVALLAQDSDRPVEQSSRE
jgi:phosphate:Na+ symporter